MIRKKLENLKDKFTERANTLFTSMKDEEEHKKIKTRVLEDEKESRRADLLYPTMKDKEEKKEEKLDKIDVKKEEEVKTQKEHSKLTNNASNKGAKRSLKEVDLNDDEYEVSDNTISVKKKKEKFETINNVKFPNDIVNEKIESLKKEAKETRKNINDEYIKNAAKLEQFGIDNSNNFFIKKGGEAVYGKETIENLNMSKIKSYLDTDYAKQHKIYNNYKEVPTELREYFKNKISEQIGEDKLDKTKGILIDSDTKSSKDLKDYLISNDEFIGKLKKFDKALKNNYSINDSIQFTGKNWGNAIGRADIRNMHINKNGDIELYITDVYDFNEGEKNDLVRVGRNRQDKGEIIPYFYAYRVIIPKNEKNEI